jgi:RHS repeat-associated protein
LNYAYNLAGELASLTNPLGTLVNYSYDKIGRATGATGSAGANPSVYASSMTYRAFGAIKSMSYGDGRGLSTTYDSRMRPTKWDVSSVLGYNYNYDYLNEHTGRVTYAGSIYDPTLDRSYEYDQVGRLSISHSGTEARAHVGIGQWGTLDGPYSQGYDYDVWGNVTHKYGWGGEVQGGTAGQTSDIYYTYANNQRSGFGYDASGNLTNDLGQTFTYDATEQQAAATYGGYSLQQNYDGNGLRVKKNDNGAITYYVRSSVLGGQVVAELNASGVVKRTYTYLGGQLLSLRNTGEKGSGAYWIHEDPITKSKRVTNSLGTVVSTVELDPWGADTPRSNNAAFQPKKFTTYERDGNKSDEAMFRRYNRYHSRFDQPDPYDGSYSLTNPQSFNRYAYVRNDPVNLVDPTGLEAGPPNCAPGTVPMKDGLGVWQCVGTGNSVVTVNGRWDDLSAYLPNWSAGSTLSLRGFGMLMAAPQDSLTHLENEVKGFERKKIMDRLVQECINNAYNTFKAEVSQITGGGAKAYVKEIWRLSVPTPQDVVGIPVGWLLKSYAGPLGILVGPLSRDIVKHADTALKLAEAQGRYQGKKEWCDGGAMEGIGRAADAEMRSKH